MSLVLNDIWRTTERINLNGEWFSPQILIVDVLEFGCETIWYDPTKTWLEPSCGDGNFLVAIFQKLMITLEKWQPDELMRHKHIIENMLYGIDIMQDNINQCIKRLGAGCFEHHLVCANALTYHYRFDEWIIRQNEELFLWPEEMNLRVRNR